MCLLPAVDAAAHSHSKLLVCIEAKQVMPNRPPLQPAQAVCPWSNLWAASTTISVGFAPTNRWAFIWHKQASLACSCLNLCTYPSKKAKEYDLIWHKREKEWNWTLQTSIESVCMRICICVWDDTLFEDCRMSFCGLESTTLDIVRKTQVMQVLWNAWCTHTRERDLNVDGLLDWSIS